MFESCPRHQGVLRLGRHKALILLSSTGRILGMSPVGGPWSVTGSMLWSASCGNQEPLRWEECSTGGEIGLASGTVIAHLTVSVWRTSRPNVVWLVRRMDVVAWGR